MSTERIERLRNPNTIVTLPEYRHETTEEILEFRRHFVVDVMHWRGVDHTDDRDRYDESDQTLHLAERGENGELLASLRLSNVNSADELLSLEMLAENPQLQTTAREKIAPLFDQDATVWDLTRLVTQDMSNQHSDKLAIRTAMLRLFGAGLEQTARETNTKPLWVFATSREFHVFLQHMRIDNELLVSGLVDEEPHNDETSASPVMVCLVDPTAAFAKLREQKDDARHGFSYQYVADGFQTSATWTAQAD